MIIWWYNSWCLCEYIIYQFIKSKPITEIKLYYDKKFKIIVCDFKEKRDLKGKVQKVWTYFKIWFLVLFGENLFYICYYYKKVCGKTVHIKRLTLKKQIYSARTVSSFWVRIYWVTLQHQSTKIGTLFWCISNANSGFGVWLYYFTTIVST